MDTSMRVRLVIFDWGGTTVDFGCCAPVAAFIAALKSRDITITSQQARIPMGLAKRDHIRELLKMPEVAQQWLERYGVQWTEQDVDSIYESFLPFQKDVAVEMTRLVPGVLESQRYLRSLKIAVGSSTGYPRVVGLGVQEKARELGFEPDAIEFGDQVPAGRPAPWMIYRNMERTGVFPPAAVVKVGDTVPDILAGRNAGVWSIGVTRTSSEVGLSESEWQALSDAERKPLLDAAHQKLSAAGAHQVIESLESLPDVIEQIQEQLNAGVTPS